MSIESTDGLNWDFTLTNSSTAPPSDSLIDAFGINIDALLTTSTVDGIFTVANFDPIDWTFSTASGGIQFDYTGDRGAPASRLGIGESLTFDFIFETAVGVNVWTGTDGSSGAGFGGGEDFGQVAVSFQQLGSNGNSSDLLASNWTTSNDDGDDGEPRITPVSEPGALALMGLGLLGVLGFRRKH